MSDDLSYLELCTRFGYLLQIHSELLLLLLLLVVAVFLSTATKGRFSLFIFLLLQTHVLLLVLPSIVPTLILLSLVFLQALGVLLDNVAELIGYLRMLPRQLAVIVPSSLLVTPVRQIHLLIRLKSIFSLLDLVVQTGDAFIDSISLSCILLVSQRALANLTGIADDLGVELSDASCEVIKLLSELLTELLVVGRGLLGLATIAQQRHLQILLFKERLYIKGMANGFTCWKLTWISCQDSPIPYADAPILKGSPPSLRAEFLPLPPLLLVKSYDIIKSLSNFLLIISPVEIIILRLFF